MSKADTRWIDWGRQLRTMAQTGLTYSRDAYDIERYHLITAIAEEMLALQSGAAPAEIRDLFAHERGHATPKVDVRVAVFRDETVLLVRERLDGRWALPGGWADVGESAAEAATREAREESGYEVRIRRLLALYDKDKHPHPPQAHFAYKLFFDAEIVGGGPAASGETDEVGFFPVDALPDLSLKRVLPQQIRRLYALHRDPMAPTEFD